MMAITSRLWGHLDVSYNLETPIHGIKPCIPLVIDDGGVASLSRSSPHHPAPERVSGAHPSLAQARTNNDEKNFFENHLRTRVTPAPSRSHLCLAGNPSRRLSNMTKAMSQQASSHADTGAKAIVSKTLATPLDIPRNAFQIPSRVQEPFFTKSLSFSCSRGGAREGYLLAIARLGIKMKPKSCR
jgi:hypothetical protein